MTQIVERNFLEIKSIEALIESKVPQINHSIELVEPVDFQLNKFFYKNVGNKHRWIDRLIWSENEWIRYVSSANIETYILKIENDLAGYFELIKHLNLKEIEIAYFGLLEEYHNKKLGGYLLSEAIKKSFLKKDIERVWVHTCTLDHKNALKNYMARGMKIYKKETIKV
ncbi:GNAT family N-acetyltransferase [Candidatus Pelagibacter sp. HIMB1321]|uniref:GNAT family N-acetyltransferase n=1 Tax=Candidatus Pelagibacter sp. HIMB1321 TaxID=1388755 RepID=UPI000A07EC3B|nr:GNAT family N-acetyltransferase [Candidatus Pelagibacter sp. HIMB1321]SMF80777.1 Acetyltransferase (GNAT) family protein [Candidatus Pelagibacter sp. HIMB1321]